MRAWSNSGWSKLFDSKEERTQRCGWLAVLMAIDFPFPFPRVAFCNDSGSQKSKK